MKITGIPRRYQLLLLCFCAAFISYIDRVNISVATIAMQESLGWSDSVKGYVLSSFFIGYMLLQAPAGYIASRYGGKVVLTVAVAWWSLFTILTPLAAIVSLPLLIITRIAMGLGEAAMFPGAYALLGRWIPVPERSRSVALLLSGVPIGTVFALIVTGWIITEFGWPSVFYVFGGAGLIWMVFWLPNASDGPELDPKISDSEKDYIVQNSETPTGNKRFYTPWKLILTAPAVWALIINHFCSNWSFYILLAWLPSYFKQVQGFSITYAGLFSAAPWLINFLMINIASWIADTMIERGRSVTFVRKLMQSFGLGVSGVFLLLVTVTSDGLTSVILMCAALGAHGFTWSGFGPNHLDLAPRHAGLLLGITNTAGTLPGVIGIAVTGLLVEATGAFTSAFILAACINFIGVLVWLFWGTGRKIVD
ncbi:MAG: ACS family MFS transporter [Hyphomonas sp.]